MPARDGDAYRPYVLRSRRLGASEFDFSSLRYRANLLLLRTGVPAALVGMDMLTDVFFFNQFRMDDMGGRNVVLQFVSMCFGVAAIASGLLHLTTLYEARGSLELVKIVRFDSTKFSDRAEHYLYSKGLTSTQVEVAMRIAKGMPSRQISEELNYARGTINSARVAIYKLLKVNSRIQLIELLDKNISS